MVDRLLDAILPWRCVVCSLSCSRPGICASCKSTMPWNSPACIQCGLPLANEHDQRCGACLGCSPACDFVVSPLLFEFPVNRLVHRFKFKRDLASGSVLACLMLEKLRLADSGSPDLVIPVPMHRWRLMCRGLNPAFVLARQLGRSLHIPVAVHDLQRHRHTRTQTGLDAARRRRNLKGAFRWSGRTLKNRSVVLVDDVMTTGSTITECSRVLRRAGARRVSAWTIARAVPP